MNNTECIQKELNFQDLGSRNVIGRFDGGRVTSDAGAMLLSEIENHSHIINSFADCFTDTRNSNYIEHDVEHLVAQRVYGICLGYEDVNDHEELRKDPLFATICGKADVKGEERKRNPDKGKPLAGKSTLNRMETAQALNGNPDRYKKIFFDEEKIDDFFVDQFIRSYGSEPDFLVLDIDATDDPVHGHQQGRFFHGYYDHYCYLPLYIFCDNYLLRAKLKTANLDPGNDALPDLKQVIERIRLYWPNTRILIRGDSGFCREEIMAFCEENPQTFYLFGLPKNKRLIKRIMREMEEAKEKCRTTMMSQRIYKDFTYQTLKTWSEARRVVGKAECSLKGENPRFVVTNLPKEEYDAKALYEDVYCARGDMENRIKEQQLFLFADRTSCHMLKSNQLRLYFAAVAYVILNELREKALKGTELETAQCSTIRLKLLKVGALIKISVRKIWIHYSQAYPYQELFFRIFEKIKKLKLSMC